MTVDERTCRLMLVEYGIKLLEEGLVQGTWGNLSMRLDDRYMLVTPSGLDYNRLTGDDMVKVDIRTLEYEGKLKPTSEKGIHGAVFRKRPEIGAVIHTHSRYCSIFAAARTPVPVETPEARNVFGDRVPLAKYGLPGSKQLMEHTVEAFGAGYGCIMAAHGMICAGETMEQAFENCRLLENCCREYIESRIREGNFTWISEKQ